jgi:hypothetical protein
LAPAERTAPMRRRAAAIIARRSGSFFEVRFEVRFAGPARAFFVRRSRLLPDRLRLSLSPFTTKPLP